MYIDIHAHIGYSKLYPAAYMAGMLGNTGNAGAGKINSIIDGLLKDRDCTAYLKQMDKAGIEKAVLLIIDGGPGMGEAAMSIDEIFDLHGKVLQAHPDRFIVFGGIDPRRGVTGFDLFRKGILEYGFRGMKLYPPMGYAADDERLMPYYELCSSYRLPVLLHTGASLPQLYNSFAEPARYRDVIARYGDINFILAHMGFRLHDPVVRELVNMPNVFLDITGFQLLDYNDSACCSMLQRIFHEDVCGKILYGSDWPLFNMLKPLQAHIDLLKKLHREGGFPAASFEKIMHGNAVELLQMQAGR